MKNIYFLDFDGTVSLMDTCYAMVKRFAGPGWREWEQRWLREEITTLECAAGIFSLFDTTPERLTEYILSLEIDTAFPAFARRCRERGEELYILSDGYDLNIRLLLAKYGLDELPYFANRLLYTGGRFHVEAPYQNPECDRCGTCKQKLMRELTPVGASTVYIGDGRSDRCAVQDADRVFAKGSLLDYCREQGIPCVAFNDFNSLFHTTGASNPACSAVHGQ